MMFETIATLPVSKIAASDAWLFLWVPSPHLPVGLQLIERWGFRYSGKAFAWAKQNPSGVGWHMGTGFTTRKNTEDCLLGRRGKPPIKARDVRELIVAPRREHSQKPDEQYERIERLVAGPYVELFARTQRPGWFSWGDQVDKFREAAE
jgi:N6-adenosine-specific RNA methylase IME4